MTVLPEGVPRGHPSTASESSAIPDFTSVSIQSHKNSSTTIALTSTDCTFNCWKGRTPNRRARLYEGLSAGVVQKRFLRVSKQFPLLNWPSLVEKPFIVVSFGSVAQVSRSYFAARYWFEFQIFLFKCYLSNVSHSRSESCRKVPWMVHQFPRIAIICEIIQLFSERLSLFTTTSLAAINYRTHNRCGSTLKIAGTKF